MSIPFPLGGRRNTGDGIQETGDGIQETGDGSQESGAPDYGTRNTDYGLRNTGNRSQLGDSEPETRNSELGTLLHHWNGERPLVLPSVAT